MICTPLSARTRWRYTAPVKAPFLTTSVATTGQRDAQEQGSPPASAQPLRRRPRHPPSPSPTPPPIARTRLDSLENNFLHLPSLFQALINEAYSVTNIAGGYLFMKYQHHAILKASKALISE